MMARRSHDKEGVLLMATVTDEAINPPHYKSEAGIESIDVIEAFGLNFHLGNVVKYVLRAGKKTASPLQDLKKAQWYIQREIERLTK